MHYGFNSEQLRIISSGIPEQFLEEKPTGKGNNSLTYVSGAFVGEILNYLFSGAWSFTILNKSVEDATPYKDQEQKPIVHVTGRLRFPLYPQADFIGEDISKYEPIFIEKDGTGSKTVIGGSTVQENNYKSAATDALKRCAMLIGIGRELYFKDNDEDNSKTQEIYDWLSFIKLNVEFTPYDYILHSDEVNYINRFQKIYNKSEEEMSNYRKLFLESDPTYDNIVPANIKQYAEFLSEQKVD